MVGERPHLFARERLDRVRHHHRAVVGRAEGVGLTAGLITDAEALKYTCRIYNDWAWNYLDGLHEKLIAAAMIPQGSCPAITGSPLSLRPSALKAAPAGGR